MNKITYLCFAVLFCLSFKLFGQSSEIQRVRLDFVTPLDYTRHLLLSFTSDNSASDGVDYGYDAKLFSLDEYPDDLNWIIEGDRYVIQGVGEFNNSKYYPLGMFLTNSGEIEIRLRLLENFDTPIDVYIYDASLNTFTAINNSNYIKTLSSGDYLDRFFITFTNNFEMINFSARNSSLSVNENEINKASLTYLKNTKELLIKTNSAINLQEVVLYDILGKKLNSVQGINSRTIKISLAQLHSNSPLIVSMLTEDGEHISKRIITSQQ